MLIVAGKAKNSFRTNAAFTETNDNNPIKCNRKKKKKNTYALCLKKCDYILLLGQYDNYDPFNDPFTAIIIENDNALVDWS